MKNIFHTFLRLLLVVDRGLLMVLCDAYRVESAGDPDKERTVMKFHPSLAPIKVAIMPLMKKPDLEDKAEKL